MHKGWGKAYPPSMDLSAQRLTALKRVNMAIRPTAFSKGMSPATTLSIFRTVLAERGRKRKEVLFCLKTKNCIKKD